MVSKVNPTGQIVRVLAGGLIRSYSLVEELLVFGRARSQWAGNNRHASGRQTPLLPATVNIPNLGCRKSVIKIMKFIDHSIQVLAKPNDRKPLKVAPIL